MFSSLGISLLILLQIASISSAGEGELADTTKADPMASSSNVPPLVDIPPSLARKDTEAPAIPLSTNEPPSVDIPASPAREDTDMMIVEAPKIPSSSNDSLTTDILSSSAREDTDMILAEAPTMPSTTKKRPFVDIASSSAQKDTDMMIVEAPTIPPSSNDPLTTDIPASSAQENTDMAIVEVPAIPSSSSEPPMSDILPLVLIRIYAADYTINPTRFETINWLKKKKDKVLAGSTRFSAKEGTEIVGQIYMCDMGTFKKDYKSSKIIHDDRYCTYRTRFGDKEALRCRFEPVPFVEKVNISSNPKKEQLGLPCGPDKRGKMYHFVYKVGNFF
ncbi:uncharacterized protein LOC135838193 [Planococcus citri]|uniref:uncharacterized protein LOC135838193 n=1 Tax=Planococcus citri TaxID=170843 RepID=UPI0031F7A248